LFDLTRDVLLTSEASGALEALASHVSRRFALRRVAICLPVADAWQVHQGGSDTVRIATDALDRALSQAPAVVAGADEAILPLRQGAKTIGLLVVPARAAEHGALDAVAGVVAIAVERTQLLREREAAEIVRQKGELANTLLASLSHDLRTPLTAIRVAVENLREDVPAAHRRTQAEAAIAELERLSRLFEDILHMARIDAAAIHVDREWVTPADIVDAATAHVRHALQDHALRVDAESDFEVDLDPRVASVALSQLLENAARYSSARSQILIDARADGDGLRLTVTDHGSGLDPAEIERVFDRFYRGRAARTQSSGTGMGLAIARGLLAAVGGRVWAENAPGAGARFIVVIPAQTRRVAVRV
jgi:two-component system sensor histidine kinase KdpD